jgi:NAD(P)-dependent dehydrogenase (short-subunit alcohol dehydrogenase family)
MKRSRRDAIFRFALLFLRNGPWQPTCPSEDWHPMSSYLTDLFSLKGQVAVVIGGTGELCGAMAEGLAGAGAEVVLVGRNEAKANERLARITAQGGTGYFLSAEASEKSSLEALKEAVVARSGQIDILVNGAGVNSPTPFLEIPEDEYDRIMSVNTKATFLACQVFGAHFVAAARPASMSKGAVHNLSKNLAREWAPLGIRVNTLVPGFFPAEQNKKVLNPERVGKIMGHTPMARFGEARELIGATLLLASPQAGGFITGAEIVVDGGYHAMTI